MPRIDGNDRVTERVDIEAKVRFVAIGTRELWVYLAGLLAAAQLGKMPPLLPAISSDLGLTLLAAAALVSLIELGGALFGFPAAATAARVGEWRTLVFGILMLILGGAGEALAGSGSVIIGFRVLESLGYLSIIVSAPVIMTREAKQLSPALALVAWSTFLPVGLALGAVLSASVADLFGWRAAICLWPLSGVVLWMFRPSYEGRAARPRSSERIAGAPNRATLLLALSFGCFTCFQVGMLGLMPLYLISQKGADAWAAGLVTGLGGFMTITGVFLPFVIARKNGGSHLRGSWLLLVVSLLLPACLLLLIYQPASEYSESVALFILLNMFSGLFPCLVFASIPRFCGRSGIGVANGAVAQAGATGSLLGPPTFALFVSHYGWTGAGAFGLAISSACCALVIIVETRRHA